MIREDKVNSWSKLNDLNYRHDNLMHGYGKVLPDRENDKD
jgi:hypothetical protein